jgi:hypothetical protein
LNGNWTGRFIADMGPGHSVDATYPAPSARRMTPSHRQVSS